MSFNPLYVGANSKTTSRGASTGFQNASGSTLSIGNPVYSNTSGQMLPLDVSSESSVEAFLGLCSTSTPSSANGQVTNAGRVENVTTSFSVGDPVFAGKLTALTNSKPDLGTLGFSSGDFVIFIGVVVKNEFNPSLKDIQLLIQTVGQL